MQVITQEEIDKHKDHVEKDMVSIALKANYYDRIGDFTNAQCWLDKVAALHNVSHVLDHGCHYDDLYGVVAENLSM